MPVAVHVVKRSHFSADVAFYIGGSISIRAGTQRNVITTIPLGVLIFMFVIQLWIVFVCHVKSS